MMIFNAVSIEHTMSQFFGHEIGDRGHFFDADVFRAGDPADLAVVVRRTADRIEERLSNVFFGYSDEKPGGAKPRIEGAIATLRSLADRIAASSTPERENYHWEIFGALVQAIDILLTKAEA